MQRTHCSAREALRGVVARTGDKLTDLRADLCDRLRFGDTHEGIEHALTKLDEIATDLALAPQPSKGV